MNDMQNSNRNIVMNNTMKKIDDSKKIYRSAAAKLPIEEKLDILIKLQKMGAEVMRARDKKLPGLKRVWKKD